MLSHCCFAYRQPRIPIGRDTEDDHVREIQREAGKGKGKGRRPSCEPADAKGDASTPEWDARALAGGING